MLCSFFLLHRFVQKVQRCSGVGHCCSIFVLAVEVVMKQIQHLCKKSNPASWQDRGVTCWKHKLPSSAQLAFPFCSLSTSGLLSEWSVWMGGIEWREIVLSVCNQSPTLLSLTQGKCQNTMSHVHTWERLGTGRSCSSLHTRPAVRACKAVSNFVPYWTGNTSCRESKMYECNSIRTFKLWAWTLCSKGDL